MAVSTINTAIGVETTIQAYDASGALVGTAIELCGHDSMNIAAGTPDSADATTFCHTAKENEYGLMNAGTIDLNFKTFNLDDAGQAALNAAPINTKFQLVIDFTLAEKRLTVEVKKSQEFNLNISQDDIILNATLQMEVIGKGVWTAIP